MTRAYYWTRLREPGSPFARVGICGKEFRMPSVLKPFDNPRWVTSLYSTNELAWVWLIVRVYIGWNWLDAGWHKVTSDAWMNGG